MNTVGNAVRYPNGSLTCSKFKGASHLVPGVVLVFEVVSPGSRRLDRVIKKKEYAVVPSIRRYVMIESETKGGIVYARSHPDEPWTHAKYKVSDVLVLPEIDIEIPVGEFYEGVHLGVG